MWSDFTLLCYLYDLWWEQAALSCELMRCLLSFARSPSTHTHTHKVFQSVNKNMHIKTSHLFPRAPFSSSGREVEKLSALRKQREMLMKVKRQQMNWPVTGSQCFRFRWARTDEVSNSACWLFLQGLFSCPSYRILFLFRRCVRGRGCTMWVSGSLIFSVLSSSKLLI